MTPLDRLRVEERWCCVKDPLMGRRIWWWVLVGRGWTIVSWLISPGATFLSDPTIVHPYSYRPDREGD